MICNRFRFIYVLSNPTRSPIKYANSKIDDDDNLADVFDDDF